MPPQPRWVYTRLHDVTSRKPVFRCHILDGSIHSYSLPQKPQPDSLKRSAVHTNETSVVNSVKGLLKTGSRDRVTVPRSNVTCIVLQFKISDTLFWLHLGSRGKNSYGNWSTASQVIRPTKSWQQLGELRCNQYKNVQEVALLRFKLKSPQLLQLTAATMIPLHRFL